MHVRVNVEMNTRETPPTIDDTAPANAVRQRYPEKRVVVALPPKRISFQLRSAATASSTKGRRVLSKSQLPSRVLDSEGYVLNRPQSWNRGYLVSTECGSARAGPAAGLHKLTDL